MVFEVKETKNTPKIYFDKKESLLTIVGKSFPENSQKAYTELNKWIDEAEGADFLDVEFYLYYISSSSIIAFLDILKKLKKKFNKLSVNWMYDEDDDDMKKIGEDYKKILSGVEFKLRPVDEH